MAPLNFGGLNDLAGVTEIPTLDLGAGSRRGSFSKPNPLGGNRTTGSDSKDRQRDHSTGSGIGIPRPQTGANYDNKRPLTQDNIRAGLGNGGFNTGFGQENNIYDGRKSSHH